MNSDDLWKEISSRGKMLAGPWVPSWSGMVRSNIYGLPIALAHNQSEIIMEDARLVKLGYELTDKGRMVPDEMLKMYKEAYSPNDDVADIWSDY